MTTYIVSVYDEAPIAPTPHEEYSSLTDARRAVRRHLTRVPDRTLAGEPYDDGTRHVEAYYDDRHRSSGYWITSREED